MSRYVITKTGVADPSAKEQQLLINAINRLEGASALDSFPGCALAEMTPSAHKAFQCALKSDFPSWTCSLQAEAKINPPASGRRLSAP